MCFREVSSTLVTLYLMFNIFFKRLNGCFYIGFSTRKIYFLIYENKDDNLLFILSPS